MKNIQLILVTIFTWHSLVHQNPPKAFAQTQIQDDLDFQGIYSIVDAQSINSTEYVTLGASAADINAAIQRAASVGGGVVRIPAGVYTIDSAISLGSNVALVGSGANTVIQLAPGSNAALIRNSNTASGNTDLAVRDLRLVGNGSSGNNGIRFERVTRVLVENVQIENVNGVGIAFNNGGSSHNSGAAPVNHLVVVRGCRIIGPTSDGISGVFNRAQIVENYVENIPSSHGIHLHTTGRSRDVVVANNIVRNAWFGIVVTNSFRVAVTGNQINLTDFGITLDGANGSNNTTIAGNSISTVSQYGIYVESDNHRDIAISGNVVTQIGSAGQGIRIIGGRGTSVTGNTVSDGGRWGILGIAMTHSAITGNVVKRVGGSGTTDAGIQLQASGSGARSLYVSITGNRVADDRVPTPLEYGIRILNSRYILITGNLLMGVQTSGGTFQGFLIDSASSPYVRRPACSNLRNGDSANSCP